jgi:VIT1/CCC1 family predicted Fe2+/Mn2+ transporter
VAALAPPAQLMPAVGGAALFSLGFLGALAARAGGAAMLPGAMRVTFWSALAMGVTSAVGTLFGVAA